MEYNITLLPGDGIGPEIMHEAKKILYKIAKKYNHTFILDEQLIGAEAIQKMNNPLPEETLLSAKKSDALLLACVGTPEFDNNPNQTVRPEQGLLKIRKELNLFSNIRPIKIFKSLAHLSPIKETIVKDTDFIIVRELTGGIYFGDKQLSQDKSLATDLCSYSIDEIEQVSFQAFALAQKRNNKVTLVDKANVLETSRLWRRTVKKIQQTQFPDIQLDFLYVDNATMKIITNPKSFDVILTENMFGDILSDEASVITGSIGLLPSASFGEKFALFEPVHGSYPQAKGKNIANPIAMILSVQMMLEYFNMKKESLSIANAINDALNNEMTTEDINTKNPKTTQEVGDYLVSKIF